jgi:hypothetical protein
MLLRRELREATQGLYLELNSLDSVQKLFKAESSLDDYEFLIRSLSHMWSALEYKLKLWNQEILVEPYSRTADLLDDLEFLGAGTRQMEISNFGEQLSNIDSLDHAYAVQYVIDGTLMGLQTFSRRLKSRWSLSYGAGASFFDLNQEFASKKWAMTLDTIHNAAFAEVINIDQVCQKAVQTLTAMILFLAQAEALAKSKSDGLIIHANHHGFSVL